MQCHRKLLFWHEARSIRLDVTIQSLHDPLPHVDCAGEHPRGVSVLGAELGPAHGAQVMPAVLVSADQGAPTVPVAQGHAALGVLRPCQPKSYKISFVVIIR